MVCCIQGMPPTTLKYFPSRLATLDLVFSFPSFANSRSKNGQGDHCLGARMPLEFSRTLCSDSLVISTRERTTPNVVLSCGACCTSTCGCESSSSRHLWSALLQQTRILFKPVCSQHQIPTILDSQAVKPLTMMLKTHASSCILVCTGLGESCVSSSLALTN